MDTLNVRKEEGQSKDHCNQYYDDTESCSSCSNPFFRVDYCTREPGGNMIDDYCSEQKQFILLIFLCVVFIALPFFFVWYIPVTDLPQHLAQIRLFEDILKNPLQTEYSLNAYGANSLVYLLIGLNWIIFEPISAGKAVVLELALMWMISLFALAHRKKQSPSIAALACVFIFNTSLYWGFINFLLGWPIFILWYLYVIDHQKKRSFSKEGVIVFFISTLLFFAHALWLLVGLLLLLLGNILRKKTRQQWFVNCCGVLPIGIWSIIWFFQFAAAREHLSFDTTPSWHTSFLERLDPYWLAHSILGGIHGIAEPLVCLGIILWILLSIKTNWGNIRKKLEPELFLMGTILSCIVLVAPEKYINTIFFAQRWAPIAATFFLFSLPPPRVPELWKLGGVILVLSFFSSATSYSWCQFEKQENNGLEESLAHISDTPKVLGLDYLHESKYICGYPFLQTFAYAQVLHGGTLNFSFAEHNTGIVILDPAKKKKSLWTEGLEWYPDKVKTEDMKYFDYALIHGTAFQHQFFSARPELVRITEEGSWRLYRCIKDTSSPH
jgi:hypothetical protein